MLSESRNQFLGKPFRESSIFIFRGVGVFFENVFAAAGDSFVMLI